MASTSRSLQNACDTGRNRAWFFEWLVNWTFGSPQKLRAAEKCLLSHLQTPYDSNYVDIGPVVGHCDQIRTICLNAHKTQHVPIVALHGMSSGLAFWLMNLDALARDRAVFAIDMLGFGRSTRPLFSIDALNCEHQMVEALEEWRSELKLSRMILLGHSLGAFVATTYALSYPDRVQHLVLAEPWGFELQPAAEQHSGQPLWMKICKQILLWFNPYWLLRAAGPFGTWLTYASAPELQRSFQTMLGQRLNQLTQYMYQCNAATPSGEAAFRTLSKSIGYAKQPLLERIGELPSNVGMTLIYGSKSWLSASTGSEVKAQRAPASVDVIVIQGAGHQVHAEQSELFNLHTLAACKRAEGATNPEC